MIISRNIQYLTQTERSNNTLALVRMQYEHARATTICLRLNGKPSVRDVCIVKVLTVPTSTMTMPHRRFVDPGWLAYRTSFFLQRFVLLDFNA